MPQVNEFSWINCSLKFSFLFLVLFLSSYIGFFSTNFKLNKTYFYFSTF